MPADRLVTLRISATGTRNEFGEFVPGEVSEFPGVWATVLDAGSSDLETGGGVQVVQRKEFTIRWRADVLEAGPSRLDVVDEYDRLFLTEELTENTDPNNRRRFVTVVGVATT